MSSSTLINLGTILVHSLQTHTKWVDHFIVEVYPVQDPPFQPGTRLTAGSSKAKWNETTLLNEQTDLIKLQGLVAGQTYQLRAGVTAPVSGLITWLAAASNVTAGSEFTGGGGGGGGLYDISITYTGILPCNGYVLLYLPFHYATKTLRAGLPNSSGACIDAPASDMVFNIRHIVPGTEPVGDIVGTITFPSGQITTVTDFGSDVIFNINDILSITADGPFDPSFSTFGLLIKVE